MSVDSNSVFGHEEPPLRRFLFSSNDAKTERDTENSLKQTASLQNSSTSASTSKINSSSVGPTDASLAKNQLSGHNLALAQIKPSSGFPLQSSTAVAHSSLSQPTMWQPSPEDLTVERSPLELLLQSAQANVQRTLADQVTPVRLAGHLSVLVVAAFILFISRIAIPNWDISIRSLPTASLEDASLSSGGAVTRISQMLAGQDPNLTFASTSLQRAVVPFTIIPEQPQPGIQSYSVQPGDTVMAIAQKFGLKPESIQWANPDLELNPDLLRIGDQLEILPVDGALHRVKPGDTLSTIAQEYKVSVDDIVGFGANEITDANVPLVSGAQLIIPNGVKPQVAVQVFAYNGAPTTAVKGSGSFVWPTSGSVTQRFWSGHPGIDIGSWTGAPVKAVDGGHVVVAQTGWNSGYGNHVIIDHGNGFASLYAHLSSFYVRVGENVTQGQQIGAVGNTGNSTGPHLHLEIRYQGSPRNPFSYLN